MHGVSELRRRVFGPDAEPGLEGRPDSGQDAHGGATGLLRRSPYLDRLYARLTSPAMQAANPLATGAAWRPALLLREMQLFLLDLRPAIVLIVVVCVANWLVFGTFYAYLHHHSETRLDAYLAAAEASEAEYVAPHRGDGSDDVAPVACGDASRQAWVTMVTTKQNDWQDSLRALLSSIEQHGGGRDVVILTTQDVIDAGKFAWVEFFLLDVDFPVHVIPVRPLDDVIDTDTIFAGSGDDERHPAFYRFFKLRVWELTQYAKVVFLDADVILLRNTDELFCYPEPSAVRDIASEVNSWFNTGVVVLEPSDRTFDLMKRLMRQPHLWKWGDTMHPYCDQGFLNVFFRGEWVPLPTKFNMFNKWKSMYKRIYDLDTAHIMHFTQKPWMGNTMPWFQALERFHIQHPGNASYSAPMPPDWKEEAEGSDGQDDWSIIEWFQRLVSGRL